MNRTTCSTILLSVVCAFGVAAATQPSAQSRSPAFQKIQVTDKFWAEGAAAGDLNRDGYNDVVAGPYWYAGPDFKKRYSIFPATQSFKVTTKDGMERTIEGYEGALGQKNGYSETFHVYTRDFNQDGWLDVLVIGFPGKEATWYENPGRDLSANTAQWRPYIAYDVVTNESPGLVDLFGNGRPVILCMTDNYIGYAAPDAESAEQMDHSSRIGRAADSARFTRAAGESLWQQAVPVLAWPGGRRCRRRWSSGCAGAGWLVATTGFFERRSRVDVSQVAVSSRSISFHGQVVEFRAAR